MKSIHELYKILYECIKYEVEVTTICVNIDKLVYLKLITDKEYFSLFSHFRKEKHWKFWIFGKNKNFTTFPFTGRSYWWDNDYKKEATKQRKLFIQHLIEKTKK